MKNLSKTIVAVVATVLLGCALAQQAQAVPVPGFTGVSTLVSQNTPGNSITVSYSVDLTAGIYTYTYQLTNPVTNTTSLDFFSVSFNNVPDIVLTVSAGGFENNNGVNWIISPGTVPGGMSAFLSFTTAVGPGFGNAQAADTNPPSPWASTNGGQQVAVPNVPEGGSALALLGLGLAGVELLRRKLRKA